MGRWTVVSDSVTDSVTEPVNFWATGLFCVALINDRYAFNGNYDDDWKEKKVSSCREEFEYLQIKMYVIKSRPWRT